MKTHDFVYLAWIVQQSLDPLARGDGLVKILCRIFIAIKCINSEVVTGTQILESCCSCSDDAAAASTEHHIACPTAPSGSARAWSVRTPKDGVLIKCVGCAGRDLQRERGYARLLKKLVTTSAAHMYLHGSWRHKPLFSRDDVIEALLFMVILGITLGASSAVIQGLIY